MTAPDLLAASADPLGRVTDQITSALPRVGLVVLIIVVGIVASALLRRVVRWLVRRSGLEALAERVGASKMIYRLGVKGGLGHLLGTLVWIGGLLVTFAIVAEVLGLPGLAEATGAVVSFLPRLIAAGAVLAGGMLLADLVRGIVRRDDETDARRDSSRVVGEVLYYAIVTVAVTMAVEQLGLETALVSTIIAIGVAGTALAVALTFALGSRGTVRHIIARHYVKPACRPGDVVTIGDATGTVARYTATALVLEDEGRETFVPFGLAMDVPLQVERLTAPRPAPAKKTSP